ncbi:hypothetical protein SAMN04488112_11381 [Melghirimyces thermohalophilus]|uniref:Uncharacterized protein n=1 Tax=Melghirimyces thermohalophilus TaxID=1236220 RepID=A0A1G6NP09_9BACL|nr:hypothetical protein SAMN04488112_11381 [Melghirimyces thermohalophilus]
MRKLQQHATNPNPYQTAMDNRPEEGEETRFLLEWPDAIKVIFSSPHSHHFRSRVRYWIASAMWAVSMRSFPSRSAMVRASFRMRS